MLVLTAVHWSVQGAASPSSSISSLDLKLGKTLTVQPPTLLHVPSGILLESQSLSCFSHPLNLSSWGTLHYDMPALLSHSARHL